MPPVVAQVGQTGDPPMMDGSAAWRPGAGAQAALQTSNLFQQPQQQPQLGWPPGRVPPPPPDVQQQLAQWYWWTQYASFCQGAAAATATGGPNHFVAGPRALDGAQGYAQGFQHYIPFPAPHLAASASVAPGGDGASGGISKPVAVRAFSSAHVAGISPIPVPSREEPAKKRSEAPARGRKRRTTPENRFCVNCGTTNTPFWRKHKSGGALCNACGLYMAKNDAPRPRLLWTGKGADAGSGAAGPASEAQPGTSGSLEDGSVGNGGRDDSPAQVLTPDGRTPDSQAQNATSSDQGPSD